ncbi:MAG TPA: DUF983 domain-containing protein [Pseudonocardiaceae bacterium]|nr:DUF983 domain-containing protein [Pseudonocardiaceae bacterium]
MTRLVKGADGRMWTLRSRVEWSKPATSDDFDHDFAGGSGPGLAMVVALIVLVAALIWWTPTAVTVPAWLILLLFVVILFFPVRWLLRRPWSVVANTPGNQDDLQPERWQGTVRGLFSIRLATAKLARDIEVYSMPNVDGPLQPID